MKNALLTLVFFFKLVFDRAFPSRTSLQPNMSQVSLPPTSEKQSRSLRLIDIPGHPRLRDQFTQYLDQAKAVVFVVDASTIARNGAAVAEWVDNNIFPITTFLTNFSHI
ncbi:MAG TPA: ADP-ribosylation factor-like protein [Chlamydiales bacterium]|nr:ADP-ribosylation factor-like protein [Chlamydiales bacterium]